MVLSMSSVKDCEPSMGGVRVAAEHLAEIPLFLQIDASLLQAIARHCRLVKYRTDEFVVRQSEPSTHVHFVVAGRLRSVVYSPEGKEVAFAEFEPGDYIGEQAAIDRHRHQTSVIALEPSTMLRLAAAVFIQIVQKQPKVSFAIARHMSLTNRCLSQRICEFSTLGVQQRVRAEVLRLARQQRDRELRATTPAGPKQYSETVIIPGFPTHSSFANRISTHREAVTREINSLERAGLIERKHGEFIVHVNELSNLVHRRRRPTLH